MGLEVYRQKRRFGVTPEPRGRTRRGKGNEFVIQKHAARRLHYDLRLELDGVMKSWAVTRGPSLVPGDKRLAIQTEDHPIEYNSFEGTIPEGEYGGGTVLIWDRGHWHPDGDPHKGLKKGRLDFTLEGEKLKGRWHLVRMRGRSGESKQPWLLLKASDEAARSARDPDILEEKPLSVVSGRSIPEIAAGKGGKRVWHSNRPAKENVKATSSNGRESTPAQPRAVRGRATSRRRSAASSEEDDPKSNVRAKEPRSQAARPPDFVPPSLATLRAEAPIGKEWVHEIKFDGYRIQARRYGDDVRLLTRKGLDWTSRFPNVATGVGKLPVQSVLIDGEVVVEDKRGISSFSELQAALKANERERFVYYVFDLLFINGRDLTGLPLLERKAELAKLLDKAPPGPLQYSAHFEEQGAAVLHHACEMGLEGIVSKRKDASYRSGRSDLFIKTKCSNAQEFVVGGYSPSTAAPRAIGALVAGYYDRGRLIYAGRIGTGYTHKVAADLWKRLHALERKTPPFDEIPRVEARRRDIRWVEPKLVIEAHLRGWTADGLVRQAAFKGVREDKPPLEVVRELPSVAATKADASDSTAPVRRAAARSASATIRNARGRSAADGRSTLGATARKARQDEDVRFTNPERVYWVDVGLTKQDLADYYRLVWDWMAPHVVNRPLALVRCPDGTKGECFFQKHASAGLSEAHLRSVIDKNKRQVLALEDLAGLLSLVQAGVLEVHVRGSLLDHLDVCDRIVFDIDPGPGVDWAGVIAAARDVRERLVAVDLQSFVKLSGGKGLHVVVPITGADWDTVKLFAQAVALAMVADSSDRYVAKMTKSLRSGKIFVDYFRNSLEQTSVAAYSTRAREGAPVSVPLSWEELSRTTGGNQYTVLNISRRLRSLKRDPWEEMGKLKQALPDLRELRAR